MSPAAILNTDVPVARLDGAVATPTVWSTLLAERLAAEARIAMSPERRFGVTLFVSLALRFPTLQELVANNVTLASVLMRYAVGLGVAWIAVAGIDRLFTGYRAPTSPVPGSCTVPARPAPTCSVTRPCSAKLPTTTSPTRTPTDPGAGCGRRP